MNSSIKFTAHILGFEYYLKSKAFSEKTIKEHLANIRRFKEWIKTSHIKDAERITYTELLEYVKFLKEKGLKTPTINLRLGSLRKYFEHLKEEGIIEVNVARKVFIKGTVKSVIIHPFSYVELVELYHLYTKPREVYREERSRQVHERNSIILGLMIWQGVHSGELSKLEVEHINLSEGTIYIPSAKRSNPRELKLESKQIIALHTYLNTTNFKPDENAVIRLFSCHINNTLSYLINELKGIHPQIRNASHIRSSVILHWLKMYDKRTVQYMIGHKYISSVEHYEVQELTELTDLLAKHHPFG